MVSGYAESLRRARRFPADEGDRSMALTLVLFIGSAVFIYLACEYFVNGVEWVGRRLAIGETATGTILAAFGTALPESVVTFVAVVFGTNQGQKDIGVGAALGGPLALSTLAYSVVGLTLMGSRRLGVVRKAQIDVDSKRLSRDQAWFLCIFIFKIALGLVGFSGKSWLGFLFLAAYGLYVAKELRADADVNELGSLEPLKIRPKTAHPSLVWAAFQTSMALCVIFIASRIFVDQLGAIGPWLDLPPQLVALVLSPIATEMPETMNAVIWVRQGKERLALANISGAMMIQATIPSALGLIFTHWLLDPSLILGGIVTLLAIVALYMLFRSGRITPGRLACASALYLLFAGILFLR
jgi:cation:H+ antiporter